MDPEPSRDDVYEGFFSAEKRNVARSQRPLMYEWRLLCSGQDPELVGTYSRGEGLSFEESQRLDDDLCVRKDVLSWRQLQTKCRHSLSHFVAASKHFRVPSPETLVDMAEVGGASAVSALLHQRKDLTDIELRRLARSPKLWAKVESLAPELLTDHQSLAPDDVVKQVDAPEEASSSSDVALSKIC